jgi:hypothetical protein
MDELQRAQSNLGRALARSKAGEDRVLVAQVRERGEQFANHLNGLIRMGRVHAPDNHAFDQPVQDLKRNLDSLMGLLGSVQLVTVEDQVYLNDVRMKVPGATPGHDLGSELHRHNIGGLTFHGEVSPPQLRRLVALLGGKAAPQHPRTTLLEALRVEDIRNVELFGIFRFRMSEDEAGGDDPLSVVRKVVRQVEDTWDNLASGRQANVLALRRLVVELLAIGPLNEALWLAELPQASPHGWHAYKVTQLVLMLAQAVGLAPGLQQDFGVAAMTHDVGYAAPGVIAPSLEGHPMAGARALLRQLGFHEAKIRRAFGALYHHAELETAGRRTPLVGRMLRIAEDYDTMTRASGGAMTPPEALGHLAAGANRHYDPVLTQLLINGLGQFPPGTYLALEDGRIVRSCSAVRSPELFAKPRAVLIRAADGAAPAQREFIDLATEGKVRGALKPRTH